MTLGPVSRNASPVTLKMPAPMRMPRSVAYDSRVPRSRRRPAVIACTVAHEATDERPPAGRRGRRHLFAHGRRLTREACNQPWATSAAGHAGPPEAFGRLPVFVCNVSGG